MMHERIRRVASTKADISSTVVLLALLGVVVIQGYAYAKGFVLVGLATHHFSIFSEVQSADTNSQTWNRLTKCANNLTACLIYGGIILLILKV